MSEQDVKKIFLFFYYNFLNVDKATESARQITFKNKMNALKPLSFDQPEGAIALIKKCMQILQANKERMTVHTPIAKDSRLHHISDFHNDIWRDFIRTTPEDEYLALIWLHILKLDLPVVSIGLQTSEGTLRYRVSRALKKLVEISK